MANGIIFRHINGRAVPIRAQGTSKTSVKKKDLAKGAAAIVAGTGVAIGTGLGAAEVVKKSADITRKARFSVKANRSVLKAAKGQMPLFGEQALGVKKAAQALKKAAVHRKTAMLLFKARNPLLAIGGAASAALLGEGIKRTHEAITGKKELPHQEAISRSLGLGVTALAAIVYYRSLGLKSVAGIVRNVAARMKGIKRPIQLSFDVMLRHKK